MATNYRKAINPAGSDGKERVNKELLNQKEKAIALAKRTGSKAKLGFRALTQEILPNMIRGIPAAIDGAKSLPARRMAPPTRVNDPKYGNFDPSDPDLRGTNNVSPGISERLRKAQQAVQQHANPGFRGLAPLMVQPSFTGQELQGAGQAINHAMSTLRPLVGQGAGYSPDPATAGQAMRSLIGPSVPQQTSQATIRSLAQGGSDLTGRAFRAINPTANPAANELNRQLMIRRAAEQGANQGGYLVPGATIPTAVGLGATALAAGAAGYAIDRGMKKTYGTGLLPNAREGMRQPVRSAQGGLQMLAENLGYSPSYYLNNF